MYDLQNTFVSVTAKGTAQATFTSVQYAAAVNTNGKTGPKAKEAAKTVIAEIRAVIKRFADEAGLDMTRLKTDFSVTKAMRYDDAKKQQVHDGYNARYSIAFSGKNVALATKVHDALTSIEGAEAESPSFLVDDSLDLEADAFRMAVVNAKARFEIQCLALGERTEAFQLVTWSVGEDQPHRGKTMALARMAGGGDPVDLEPGKAEKTVTVTLHYDRTL